MLKPTLLPLFAALLLAGCATQPYQTLVPSPVSVPVADESLAADRALDARNGLELEVDAIPAYVLRDVAPGDALPELQIAPVSLATASLADAFAVIAPDLPLSLDGQLPAGVRVELRNVGGSLAAVLRVIESQTGLWIRYNAGVLHVSADRPYVVELPPVGKHDALMRQLGALGATALEQDETLHTIAFRASRKAFDSIDTYLERVRDSKALVMYDVSIVEVRLADKSSAGINWSLLGSGRHGSVSLSSAPATNAASTGGFGAGVAYRMGAWELSAMMRLLESQGAVRMVSQPKLAVLSGETGTIKSGIKTSYVKEITSTVGTSGTVSNSVTVEDLLAGLDMSLKADTRQGTVWTHIKLSLTDLLAMTPQEVAGSTINLPSVGSRELDTMLRAAPGDAIVIGGLITGREERALGGVLRGEGGIGLPTDKARSVERTELVIVLRPQVVKFKER